MVSMSYMNIRLSFYFIILYLIPIVYIVTREYIGFFKFQLPLHAPLSYTMYYVKAALSITCTLCFKRKKKKPKQRMHILAT